MQGGDGIVKCQYFMQWKQEMLTTINHINT